MLLYTPLYFDYGYQSLNLLVGCIPMCQNYIQRQISVPSMAIEPHEISIYHYYKSVVNCRYFSQGDSTELKKAEDSNK